MYFSRQSCQPNIADGHKHVLISIKSFRPGAKGRHSPELTLFRTVQTHTILWANCPGHRAGAWQPGFGTQAGWGRSIQNPGQKDVHRWQVRHWAPRWMDGGVHAGTPLPTGSNERRKYSTPSLSTRAMFQDPQRVPETVESTEPHVSCTMFFLSIHPYDKV